MKERGQLDNSRKYSRSCKLSSGNSSSLGVQGCSLCAWTAHWIMIRELAGTQPKGAPAAIIRHQCLSSPLQQHTGRYWHVSDHLCIHVRPRSARPGTQTWTRATTAAAQARDRQGAWPVTSPRSSWFFFSLSLSPSGSGDVTFQKSPSALFSATKATPEHLFPRRW